LREVGAAHGVDMEIIATGSKENILAVMAHGERLGIQVIPELYSFRKYEVAGVIAGIIMLPLYFIRFSVADPIVFLFVFALLTQAWSWATWRGEVDKARERGNKLRGSFPATRDRKAGLDDLYQRGML